MIRELVKNLEMGFKKMMKAIKAGFVSVTYHLVTPSLSAFLPFSGYVVPTGVVNALNVGKRYRLTSGHAPIFSLFSFFGNRQTP
jgi:hypothetical protein